MQACNSNFIITCKSHLEAQGNVKLDICVFILFKYFIIVKQLFWQKIDEKSVLKYSAIKWACFFEKFAYC